MKNSRGRKTKPKDKNFGSGKRKDKGFTPYKPDLSGRKDNRGRGSREGPRMTKVTCDECGTRCEVPFRPTAGKPVLCSECFGNEGKRSGRDKKRPGRNSDIERRLDEMDQKLDRIMKALDLL